MKRKRKHVQPSIAAVRAAEKLTVDEITALALLGDDGVANAGYAIEHGDNNDGRFYLIRSTRSPKSHFRVHVHTRTTMPADMRSQVMELTEGNMKRMYEDTPGGWDTDEKEKELFDKAARFVALTDPTNESRLAGFVNWRFDTETFMDDDPCVRNEADGDVVEVAYCYELQVSSAHKRHGIGAVLMAILETVARACSMRKVVLTVFACNAQAMRFYRNIGYEVDPISPSLLQDAEDVAANDMGEYEIMSKLTWTP